MISLLNLQLQSFRNLHDVQIELSPHFNIFHGQNGAGKTSLLESIYYLGLGRSFRTNQLQRIIQYNAESFSIFIQLQYNSRSIPIGIARKRNGERLMKFNGETISSISSIAKQLPIQLMSTMSYKFFSLGPKIRRQFLDWMLFHVEQSFYAKWQSLQRVLKQRNAGLKANLPPKQIISWDTELLPLADEIDRLRSNTVTLFKPFFFEILNQLLPQYPLKIIYSRGWNKDDDLANILDSNLRRDYQLGYTQFGPQRADLHFYIDGIPAQDVLSQGQQKLVLYAFHLAQGLLLKQKNGISPIYLIDDLPSELDQSKRHCVTEVLKQLDSQVFITTIDASDLGEITALENTRAFHVEHGTMV